MIDLDELTQYMDNSLFRLDLMPVRPWEYDKVSQFVFSVELNFDLIIVERKIYSTLDFMSDVGGIQKILISTFGFIVTMSSRKNAKDFLI